MSLKLFSRVFGYILAEYLALVNNMNGRLLTEK